MSLHPRLPRRWPPGAVAAVLLMPLASLPLQQPSAAATAGPSSSAATAATRATVQEILDGPDLWIDRRRARVHDRATAPELLRSGESRAQLAFQGGASGRMNQLTQLRLGSRCSLLDQGQILLSGAQSLCLRSARLSVRGTHVLVDLDSRGAATISVLEGQVDVEQLPGPTASGSAAAAPTAPTTSVGQGQRLRLSAEGRVLALEPLTPADYRAFVEGPLVDGFTTPLPGQPALEATLAALTPQLSLACPARPDTTLVEAVNGARRQAGRPPFSPLPAELAERNCRHLAPVLRRILASGDCDHDRQRWQALLQEPGRSAGLTPVSELIACPGARAIDPAVVLQRWLGSPLHTDLLLNRPRASHLDCVQLTASGRTAAMCTTWGGGGPRPGI
ncbi:hypothetical protein KBZ20_14095 [Vulcanococcus limneticus Candia 3F8]|uniref:hypothetical protein n=1 Tax=Vulcanococcus limneticus TaxID=2170428 RepID=UPI000B97E184|nr:hypothetical protein [Vulcanococcus limneticus]MCP9792910.1 hypothetical protein [Vulcanococcus limneticus MW73D5]MCP9894903.1 hypothetical protein [Vulcanococcus limneticus Candia 3F8]MCP9898348.1 hypothetical protein [Vulcanococcus limneticus Candia 3B3]